MTEEQIKEEMARLKKENPGLSDDEIAEKVAEIALKKEGKPEKKEAKAEYVCHTRCTFEGVYYKEGDVLVTDAKDVPEYFTEKE